MYLRYSHDHSMKFDVCSHGKERVMPNEDLWQANMAAMRRVRSPVETLTPCSGMQIPRYPRQREEEGKREGERGETREGRSE